MAKSADNVVPFKSKTTQLNEKYYQYFTDDYFDDNISFEELLVDFEFEIKSIEVIKEAGNLDNFLKKCESLPKIEKAQLRVLVEEEKIDFINDYFTFLSDNVIQLDKLAEEEKQRYDLSNIYESYELVLELINRISQFMGTTLGLESFTIPKEKQHAKKIADNVINLFSEINNPTAEDKWNYMSEEIQEKIINNVFCIKCGITAIDNYTINQELTGIILHGKCIKCSTSVVRIIEDETD